MIIMTAQDLRQVVEHFFHIRIYCLDCTKFGQLILRKIIKIVATRCQILRLKCIKFDIGWGFVPDPAEGAHTHSTPQSWI